MTHSKWIEIWSSPNIWTHMSNCSVFQYLLCDMLFTWTTTDNLYLRSPLSCCAHCGCAHNHDDTQGRHKVTTMTFCVGDQRLLLAFIPLDCFRWRRHFLPQLNCPTFSRLSLLYTDSNCISSFQAHLLSRWVIDTSSLSPHDMTASCWSPWSVCQSAFSFQLRNPALHFRYSRIHPLAEALISWFTFTNFFEKTLWNLA